MLTLLTSGYNGSMARSSSILTSTYSLFNHDYFSNRLPTDAKVVWADIDDMGDWGLDDNGRHIIRINRVLRRWPSGWTTTLLHEMVHAATTDADDEDDHGPAFKAEMHRLYVMGAFEPFL